MTYLLKFLVQSYDIRIQYRPCCKFSYQLRAGQVNKFAWQIIFTKIKIFFYLFFRYLLFVDQIS